MQIKRFSPTTHKIKAVVYAPSGAGKTTFGATCPKPIFASAEGGLLSIAHINPEYVEIKTIQDLRDLLLYLKKGEHSYETVVLDSITEISEIIKVGIEKKSGKSMTLQDFGTLSKTIREILRGFRDLPMHVLFIALEKQEKDGDVVVRYVPDLSGKSSTEIAQFMDIVGYLTIDQATQERRIITNTNSKTLSKDRTRMIGNSTEPDFSKWIEAVKGLVVTHEEEETVYETPKASAPVETEEEETESETVPEEEAPPAPPAPTAKKAPPAKISDSQVKFAKGLLDQLTAGLDEASVASKLRGSIKVSAEVEVDSALITVDEILATLDKEQATKVIEFLKSKADAKKPAAPAEAVSEETPAEAEAPKAKKTDAEMIADLEAKKASKKTKDAA